MNCARDSYAACGAEHQAAEAPRSTDERRGTAAMRSANIPARRVEKAFGWIKTVFGQERARFRGIASGFVFTFAAAAFISSDCRSSGRRLADGQVRAFGKIFPGRWWIVEVEYLGQ